MLACVRSTVDLTPVYEQENVRLVEEDTAFWSSWGSIVYRVPLDNIMIMFTLTLMYYRTRNT